jgi:hypothetical protein
MRALGVQRFKNEVLNVQIIDYREIRIVIYILGGRGSLCKPSSNFVR